MLLLLPETSIIPTGRDVFIFVVPSVGYTFSTYVLAVSSDGSKHDGPTSCTQHSSCPWGCQRADRMKTGKRCTPVSVERDGIESVKKQSRFTLDVTIKNLQPFKGS